MGARRSLGRKLQPIAAFRRRRERLVVPFPPCHAFARCSERLANDLRTRLETNLPVKVRPGSEADRSDPTLPPLTPVLPETGEIGVIVRLGRFRQDAKGSLQVHVWVGRSGLDGLGLRYTLVPEDDGWSISDIVLEGVA